MHLRVCAAFVLSVHAHPGPAEAATITINGLSEARCAVNCVACSGLLTDGAVSENTADAFELEAVDEAAIADFVSDLLATDIDESDVIIMRSRNGPGYAVMVHPGYFFTRHGRRTAFFRSHGDQPIEFVEPEKREGKPGACGTIEGEILGFRIRASDRT